MKKATTLDDFIQKQMKDKEFALLYEKECFINKIAKLVTELRQKSGITQEELAKKAHTSQPVIARLESGRDARVPSLELLNRVAHGLNAQLNISLTPLRH